MSKEYTGGKRTIGIIEVDTQGILHLWEVEIVHEVARRRWIDKVIDGMADI